MKIKKNGVTINLTEGDIKKLSKVINEQGGKGAIFDEPTKENDWAWSDFIGFLSAPNTKYELKLSKDDDSTIHGEVTKGYPSNTIGRIAISL
jgi:hypothetical protein